MVCPLPFGHREELPSLEVPLSRVSVLAALSFRERSQTVGRIPQNTVEYSTAVIIPIPVTLVRQGEHLPRQPHRLQQIVVERFTHIVSLEDPWAASCATLHSNAKFMPLSDSERSTAYVQLNSLKSNKRQRSFCLVLLSWRVVSGDIYPGGETSVRHLITHSLRRVGVVGKVIALSGHM